MEISWGLPFYSVSFLSAQKDGDERLCDKVNMLAWPRERHLSKVLMFDAPCFNWLLPPRAEIPIMY